MIQPANLYRTRATNILANSEAMKTIQDLASDTAAKGEYAFIFDGELTFNEKKALTDLGFKYFQHWEKKEHIENGLIMFTNEDINKYTISF